MKKTITLFLILILCLSAFIFTGCNDKEKYVGIEGVVIDKEYKEAYTTTTFIWTGKFGIPVINRHPESWYLIVEYLIEAEPVEYKYRVTEEEYNAYKIGDIFIYYGDQDNGK